MDTNKFTFTSKIDVRYAETDAMGVVHHASYAIWFEQARIDFFKAAGASYVDIEKEGFESPVLELVIQYKRPCKFGDVAEVETTLFKESALKFRFQYKVYVNGDLCTTGSSLHTFTKNGVPTREKPQCFLKVMDKVFSTKGTP